jgi:MFS family permease
LIEADKPNARYCAGIIALVGLGKFIFNVDFGMMNVALTTISTARRSCHPALIVANYSLSYAGFLVLSGRAADTFGRRRFCIFGLRLFDLGLLTGIFAANVWVLTTARALEGIGVRRAFKPSVPS